MEEEFNKISMEFNKILSVFKSLYHIEDVNFKSDENDICTISCNYDNLNMESYIKFDRNKVHFELEAKLILIYKLNNVLGKYINWKTL